MKKPIVTNLDDIENPPPAVKDPPKDDLESNLYDFRPTRSMRKAKSLAMAKLIKFPTGITLIDVKQAYELTGMREIKDWWKNPRFVDWFTNDSSHTNRIDYLMFRQLDFLEEILEGDSEYSVREKLNAGKQVLEIKKELQSSGMSEFEKQQIIEQLLNSDALETSSDVKRIERGAGSVKLPDGD